ncbi:MAG: c-type cytochrome [Planctomycetota bacterium]|jgi:mono/diheme cytochrome c family protein|nr:c-type cytochrome [Planctomycetota bacterium]
MLLPTWFAPGLLAVLAFLSWTSCRTEEPAGVASDELALPAPSEGEGAAIGLDGDYTPWTLALETEDALYDVPDVLIEFEGVLEEFFGTRGAPRFAPVPGLPDYLSGGAEVFDPNPDQTNALSLARAADIYDARCAPCHGNTGGGDGLFAERLVPRPRVHRRGIFKFKTTCGTSPPRLADLMRSVTNGLPGSAMPTFAGLPRIQRAALVEYVRLLALRGEVERKMLAWWEMDDVRPEEIGARLYREAWTNWQAVEGAAGLAVADKPLPTPELLARGRDLFLDPNGGNCFSCHGEDGGGIGNASFGTDEEGQTQALLKDEWGGFIAPRDLTVGVFRGGGQPEDLFRRIWCGIAGTPMPSLAQDNSGAPGGEFTRLDAWALAYYALSLSEG